MQLDPNPFFRKPITSWYDSPFACIATMTAMALVFVFSTAGLFVGFGSPEFRPYVWVPVFLSCSSLFLIVKIALRLKQRSKNL